MAADALQSTAWDEAAKVVKAGAVPRLAALLDDDSAFVRRYAASALGIISREGGAAAVARGGTPGRLVGLLNDEDAGVKGSAASALGSLSRHRPAAIVKAGAPAALVVALDDTALVDHALDTLRLLSHEKPGAVVKAGALPPMLRMTEGGSHKAPASAVLAVLAKRRPGDVSKAGGAAGLTRLLGDPDYVVRRHGAAALGHLIGAGGERDTDEDTAALAGLIQALDDGEDAVGEAAAVALMLIARKRRPLLATYMGGLRKHRRTRKLGPFTPKGNK